MGQHQSSEERHGNGGGPLGDVKTCYYELLDIQPQASDDEYVIASTSPWQGSALTENRIKKAYRKKALEFHPDRNYGNVEETTKLFAEVQAAYEILCDPQERAWYDSHRDAILRNEDPQGEEHYEHNVRVTTAEDIMKMFINFNGQLDYSDTPSGFYSSLQSIFATLAREESLACEWEGLDVVQYPSFGSSRDTYDSAVKAFYSAWNSFATKKTFSWKDVFRYSEAPDRKVRRMMEKENKRFRDEGIREFNEAVRALVVFVKKRDPRYMPNRQTEAERQQILRDKAAAQAARSRAANQAKLKQDILPDWATIRTPEGVQVGADESEEELEPLEHFECVICKKSFKSEQQWEAHEKSKKHLKSIQHLRRTMQKEDEGLGLDKLKQESQLTTREPSDEEEATAEPVSPVADLIEDKDIPIHIDKKTPVTFANSSTPNVKETDRLESSTSSSEFDDKYASQDEIKKRLLRESVLEDSAAVSRLHPSIISDHIPHIFEALSVKKSNEGFESPKLGKAKGKRAKKAAQKTTTTAEGQPEFKCASCLAVFPSKTRLFNHIKDFDHAAPVAKAPQGKKAPKSLSPYAFSTPNVFSAEHRS
ncbi:hypothetical protein MMC17_001110 [Xylographa soralifera]|nr:hypothetical protein [Xylographa soralifera]